MENWFSRVGQLIYDLEASVPIDPDGFEAFLNEEFREMTLQLGHRWYNNEPGLGYLLEFHKEECYRLLKKVNAMYMLFVNYSAFRDGREYLQDLYRLLIDHLNVQSVRIDKMISEPADKALGKMDGFNLN